MVHPATHRAVKAAIAALGVPLDIGFVFPPKLGEDRGYGQWTNQDLAPARILAILARAAAANARGGNIYMRLGPGVKSSHPGIVMLDDLSCDAVEQLSRDGLEPCLVAETSPGNFQSWIRLTDRGLVPYVAMGAIARHLAKAYGGDERAVSPRQPGRVPGFTNRKAKHQQCNGQFPFVKLTSTDSGRIASRGPTLLDQISGKDTVGAAAGAAPETPRLAACSLSSTDPADFVGLEAIFEEQQARILRQVSLGRRPLHAGSRSEVDFAVAVAAIRDGINPDQIAAWLEASRPEKHGSYALKTVAKAIAAVPQGTPQVTGR